MSAKVLILGSQSDFMDNIAERVASDGLEVARSDDPGEALSVAREWGADVVVLNLRDLLADGVVFLRGLKKKRVLAEVITLSVPDCMSYSIQGMKAGAFADLTMPFDPDELIGRIREAAERKAKKARSIRQRLEDLAVGITYAEAGDMDRAARYSMKRDTTEETGEEE